MAIEHSRALAAVKLSINEQNNILLHLIRPVGNDGFHKVFTITDTITNIKFQFQVNKEPDGEAQLIASGLECK